MKNIIMTILPLIISAVAHAGNGGGTMQPMAAGMKAQPEIVYHMGEQDGVVRFAYGALVGDQWQVQEVSGLVSEFKNQQDLFNSLQTSKLKKDWVQVK